MILALVLGGCGAVTVLAASRILGAMTAPVDVANLYLEDVREGRGAGLACQEDDPPSELTTSTDQYLSRVDISNSRIATVEGTVTLEDGRTARVRIILLRAGDGWCVDEVRY